MNTNIYKLGKTTQKPYQRLNNYSKGSVLHYVRKCKNCHMMEDQLIRYFKVKFKQRRDISGIETFEGDCDEMIDTIHSFISKQNKRQNKTVVPEVVPESFTKSLKNVHEELQTMFIGNYRIHKFEQFRFRK